MITVPRYAYKSYVKTTLGCVLLLVVALLLSVLAWRHLPGLLGVAVAIPFAATALSAAAMAGAGWIVLARCRRPTRGVSDLFLHLNRTREASAIRAGVVVRPGAMRRWLARRLFGHDLLVGDWVEVKSWAEIHAALDPQGCQNHLPFMPEMLAMCGRRARVYRCVHRIFDYRKTRRMRHMDGGVLLVGAFCDGASHGGCEAACLTIWSPAWLRRVEGDATTARATSPASPESAPEGAGIIGHGTHPPRYVCQLTQLHAASRPIDRWSLVDAVRPLVSGNVAPAAFLVGWATYQFNALQHLRQGVAYPAFETPGSAAMTATAEATLVVGDPVIVRNSAEIRATLNERSLHRGLYFEPDMLKHCGHRYYVEAEVRRLIDIVTGEMRVMKTPAYILTDVRFSGERQLFNAQHEPLFWRAVWLRRDDA